ncbi:beta-ketoacyl synthase N-terminal-like domain-containing protein [Streptomyces sp. NPDC060020]|uniref:beta-ketoacyl synthase N-terminal-like domain-containing protein n=1 Tax=Streptomyces sp. NPDC060020 TaxID=3347038 RepID=UPI0036B94704
MTRSVAITGMTVTSSLGAGLDATWEALLGGSTAVATTTYGSGPYRGAGFAAVLSSDLPEVPAFDRKRLRALSRESLLVSRVGALAWRDAGLDVGGAPTPADVGVVLGTTTAGLDDYLRVLQDGVTHGPALVSPSSGPQASLNAVASELSVSARAEGSIVTVTAGRCSGSHALAVGADQVLTGAAEVVLVAAVETLDPTAARVDRPGTGPFSAEGGGAVPGEAVVVLVLESLRRARDRGARVLAEVPGWSTVRGDAGQDTAVRAALAALREAGLDADDIGLVCSSATGSPGVDAPEARALHEVMGPSVPVFSPFGALGDCAGASGLVQLALTARALEAGLAPPTCGFTRWDPGLPTIGVAARAQQLPLAPALVLTTDVGGQAAALVLRPPAAGGAA